MSELIYVIGMSKFGASCASILSEHGKEVIAIDINENSFDKLEDNYAGIKITGDALNMKFLEAIDLKKASDVLIAIHDDNINIFLANVCDKILKIPNVYVRLNRRGQEEILNSSNITPIYPFQLSLDFFLKSFENNKVKR